MRELVTKDGANSQNILFLSWLSRFSLACNSAVAYAANIFISRNTFAVVVSDVEIQSAVDRATFDKSTQ